ncbi:MAG: MFS transporter [Bacteroidales bacterium]
MKMANEMVNMDTMPLRWGHFRVLLVASLGQLLGAALATLIGVVIPLIQIIRHPELTSFQQGVIAGSELIGLMLGSLVFGHLSDKYGYLFFFRFCPALVLLFSLIAYFSNILPVLVVALFFMGFGIGGEYSLDPDYISEIMPKRWKLLMVGVSKSFAAIGNFLMAGVCFWLLKEWNTAEDWNKLLLTVSVLSVIMLLSRIRFWESPGWLVAHEKLQEAEVVVKHFLGNDVDLGDLKNTPIRRLKRKVTWGELFNKQNIQKTILGSVPWACEGVGVYGVGVFTPVLILVLGLESVSEGSFDKVVGSVAITSYINVFILIGFIIGLFLVNRWYHIKTQSLGFFLAAMGLILLLIAYLFHWPAWIAIAGFMMFELFLNAGPHLMTFILPTQIYTVEERGTGVGLSAAIGKFGAVAGVVFIPLLLKWGGGTLVLLFSIGVTLLGGMITLFLGRKVFPKKDATK